jgi:hypothetical protein
METTPLPRLPRLAWIGTSAFWHELPRMLAAGAVTAATAAPLGAALLGGAPGWMAALATLPPSLALTGLAAFAAEVARGDAANLRTLLRLDPVLALILSAGGLALATPWGAVPAAALLLVGPGALAYGAVRGRHGLAALRGGAILAAYRPSWTLTLTALGVLAGFAAAASAGVLAVAVLPLLLTIAAAQSAALLEEIDAVQGRTR